MNTKTLDQIKDEYYGEVMSDDEAKMLQAHLKQVIEISFSHVFSGDLIWSL